METGLLFWGRGTPVLRTRKLMLQLRDLHEDGPGLSCPVLSLGWHGLSKEPSGGIHLMLIRFRILSPLQATAECLPTQSLSRSPCSHHPSAIP